MAALHIGNLTSGDCCLGLRAVIRAIVVKAIEQKDGQISGSLEGGGGFRPIIRPHFLKFDEEVAVLFG